MKLCLSLIVLPTLFFAACIDKGHYTGNQKEEKTERREAGVAPTAIKYTGGKSGSEIITGNTQPADVVDFAKSMIGIPYRYGSINPEEGFDCSGFITYVFNHFNISVPRSSKEFTDVKEPIELKNSQPGDLILFTGTDSTIREVGHMGIITANNGTDISFIHSTSGKAYGVTVTPLNPYYQGRFVKAIRIFNNN